MYDKQENLPSPSHYLIVANGPLLDEEQIAQLRNNKTVVALDGAADSLRLLEIDPDVILGDFDSINNKEYWGIAHDDTPCYLGKRGVTIVPAKDQNLTDLEKGILFCDAQGALSITIIYATGGRMDHTLGNIRFLRKYHQPSRRLWIVTESQTLEYVRDSHTIIRGEIGGHCGIMAFPSATMTTRGLKYDVENFALEFGISESVCNSFAQPEAHVTIQGEALLIYPNRRA